MISATDLDRYRSRRHLTVSALAALVGVTPRQVSRWLSGECGITGTAATLLDRLIREPSRSLSELVSDPAVPIAIRRPGRGGRWQEYTGRRDLQSLRLHLAPESTTARVRIGGEDRTDEIRGIA